MSKINWQQPYVNIFKHFTIASDKNVTKSGDVSTQMDNQIKSLVYKISGTSNASNFISIPKLSGQSLMLTGRYVYILFKPIANKYFSLHIDVSTAEKTLVRVSFGNTFREFKSSQTWLQFPYVIQAPNDTVFGKIEQTSKDLTGAAPPITKWTVLCVDMMSLLESYTNRTYESVRGFKLSANMLVKNVITSDCLYEPGVSCGEARARRTAAAFPRELAYPCEKHDQWARLYDFVTFPGESTKRPFDSAGQSRVFVIATDKENQPKRADVRQVAPSAGAIPHSAIDTLTFKSRSMSRFGTNGNNIVLDLPLVGVPLDNEDHDECPTPEPAPHDAQLDLQQDIHVYPSHNWQKSDRLCDENNGLYSSSCSSLSSLANDDLSVANKKRTYQTCLEPDPIMKLNKIIGFSTTTCKSIRWSNDSQYIIYSCQANLIAYHLNSHAQYCYVGHADSISCVAVSPDNSTIASGQSGPNAVVRLWKFDTQKCVSTFRAHDHSLYLLQYSSCGQYLCGVGRDKQSKTLLVVWDLSSFSGARKKADNAFAKLIAKAHTDVHINQIMFLNYDSSRLISCGRDNVRFWRLKNDTLRSCAVNLSPYIQALNMVENNADVENKPSQRVYLEFTDLAVNSRPDNNENLVYACTKAGQIFVFNSAKMEIENVRILEPIMEKSQQSMSSHKNALKLNSLTVSDAFCVTGSDDGYVRVWPLDFSQVSVEAEHEKSIGCVRFSPDCLKIVTSTLNGNLESAFWNEISHSLEPELCQSTTRVRPVLEFSPLY